MVKLVRPLLLLLLALTNTALAYENPLFSYTHMMPSPFTVPAGRVYFGTSFGIGVTDFLQLDTNILRDFYKFYNAGAKLSLIDQEMFALALTAGYESYNYHDIDLSNPDLRISAWQPGFVTAFSVLPELAWFVGGYLNFSSQTLITNGVKTSGYVTGATGQSEISWTYSPPKKKRGVGNVLSAGVSYDFTYKIFGVGVSHHWPGFHVGIHYYPNASLYKVQPILAGGASVDL